MLHCALSVALLLWLPSTAARAEPKPVWELGLGAGYLRVPDYRGADHATSSAIPFIYPVYRGKILRVDEEGVRGELFRSDRVLLDFSVDAGPSVDSGDNPVRRGMPDLDATLQIGPALSVKLWQNRERRQLVNLFFPLRVVASVDSSGISHEGYAAAAQLWYGRRIRIDDGEWKLTVGGGLEYGSDDLHDYYYSVAPRFANPARPAYAADGGFAGYRLNAAFYGRYPNYWASIFARYDHLDGAVFDDSPLLARNDGITFGFVVARIFGRSKKTVDVRDWGYE